jgi:hypothetical protein
VAGGTQRGDGRDHDRDHGHDHGRDLDHDLDEDRDLGRDHDLDQDRDLGRSGSSPRARALPLSPRSRWRQKASRALGPERDRAREPARSAHVIRAGARVVGIITNSQRGRRLHGVDPSFYP